MFRYVDDFLRDYGQVAEKTQSVLDALTDASLGQPVADDHRTLGRIAWHVVQTIPEMMGQTGLEPDGPAEDAPTPDTARSIADAYRTASRSLLDQVRARWNDDTLRVEDVLYGSRWARGTTLAVLVQHEIHHVGQMSVLMRQAGLRPPGLYGPAKEGWSSMGREPPTI